MQLAVFTAWETGLLQVPFLPWEVLCWIFWAFFAIGVLIQWLVPLLAGAVGLLMTLMMRIYPVDLPFILLFWGGYGGALLLGWAVSVLLYRLYTLVRK